MEVKNSARIQAQNKCKTIELIKNSKMKPKNENRSTAFQLTIIGESDKDVIMEVELFNGYFINFAD